MQITSRFTIAIHIITCISHFGKDFKVTSRFLSGSTNINPVMIRNVCLMLKNAGIISSRQGASGIKLAKAPSEISLYDIYKAVANEDEKSIFHFHENPNAACPVGRNIHKSLDPYLENAQIKMENELKKTSMQEIIDNTEKEIAAEDETT